MTCKEHTRGPRLRTRLGRPGDGLSHGNACPTHFSLAEVVAPCLKVIVLDLSIFEGEVPGRSLACEVMAVGMFVSSPVRTGVRHLGMEVAVVAWYAAPSGGSGRTEEMRGLTMGGDVVEPGAVGTAAAFFVLVLRQGIVLRILAVPGNGARAPPLRRKVPVSWYGALPPAVGSVSPCQFPSLAILVHQLQEAFSGVRPNEALSDRLGASDVGQLVHPELCPSLLGVGFQGLYFL